ncbi:hypothetical protein T11_7910 [Trichinella zimbabwensis]|uniref:Uncharacterized protein n=1 Tax=Trichinella zimbabwensis TaxID=268475 RepID=A0A0V1I0A4_9BILA|nr:hypothetical protein T11_7910 [Trichinella zimbabwensis]
MLRERLSALENALLSEAAAQHTRDVRAFDINRAAVGKTSSVMFIVKKDSSIAVVIGRLQCDSVSEFTIVSGYIFRKMSQTRKTKP